MELKSSKWKRTKKNGMVEKREKEKEKEMEMIKTKESDFRT